MTKWLIFIGILVLLWGAIQLFNETFCGIAALGNQLCPGD